MRIRILVAVLAALAVTASAQAQTGACPTSTAFAQGPNRGCFNPNLTEHNQTDPVTGGPNYRVDHYEVAYFAESANVATAAPIQPAVSIGKGTPNAQGSIWFGQGTATPLPAYPLGQRVKAVVEAVGPAGQRSVRGATNTSNPFGESAPALAPTAPSGVNFSGL